MKRKVNIYYAGFFHRAGGAYFHVVNISKGLIELGYDVSIITLDKLPFVFKYLPHVVQKVVNLFNFPFGFLYKHKVIKFLYRYYFKNTADIEIFEDVYTYWKSESQSIVILHALWSDNLQAFDLSEDQRVSMELRESAIINDIDVNVVTVSDPYKEFILKRLTPNGLKKSIGVVELGIDTHDFKQSIHNNNSLVYVGALEARKNVQFLIEVFQSLKSQGDYQLTIIGNGPQEVELQEFVKKNHINDVQFLGRLTHDQVKKELPKHQYYIHTSVKESFSYSLLEAKLSGLTTIAYSGLEVPEVFIDISIDEFEINEWVEKITQHHASVDAIEMDRFSFQTMTKNTLQVMERC